MDKTLQLNPNEVISYLKKAPSAFTAQDMLDFIVAKEIRMIDFMYPAEDGRVKTLNFTVNSLEYAETVLVEGERVDGSSLCPSFIEAGNRDLYVIRRYRTAFVDPFTEIPTLCFLCSFFTKSGRPFECAPYATLMRAGEEFHRSTGLTFEAMGELEYYVITEEDPLFPATDQRGYHESEPFAKLNDFRRACMDHVAKTGGQIKYGHSEVGNFTLDGKVYEQNEIEFLPCPLDTAADQLLLAKWVIRNLAWQWGLDVSFAPKITVGKAGSGMHIHMRLMKDGSNVTLGEGGKLSEAARRAIAGMMVLAPSITAFGNKNPTSYFPIRRPPQTSAGATATVRRSCVFPWAGPAGPICAPPPIPRCVRPTVTPPASRPSRCVPPTVRPIFTSLWQACASPPVTDSRCLRPRPLRSQTRSMSIWTSTVPRMRPALLRSTPCPHAAPSPPTAWSASVRFTRPAEFSNPA